jgi:hypothetical protein
MTSQPGSWTVQWRELTIPDGGPPVLVHRLFVEPATKSTTTLVRFPAGWRRPVSGHYVVEEEALFLEGSFRMTGLEYPGVTYAFFPAGYLRENSVSTHGALAIASFGGRADWVRGSATTYSTATVRVANWRKLPVSRSLAGRSGRLLRKHATGSTWIFEDAPSGIAPDDAVLELFSLADHSWMRVAPEEPIPALTAPVYCRIRTLSC